MNPCGLYGCLEIYVWESTGNVWCGTTNRKNLSTMYEHVDFAKQDPTLLKVLFGLCGYIYIYEYSVALGVYTQ